MEQGEIEQFDYEGLDKSFMEMRKICIKRYDEINNILNKFCLVEEEEERFYKEFWNKYYGILKSYLIERNYKFDKEKLKYDDIIYEERGVLRVRSYREHKTSYRTKVYDRSDVVEQIAPKGFNLFIEDTLDNFREKFNGIREHKPILKRELSKPINKVEDTLTDKNLLRKTILKGYEIYLGGKLRFNCSVIENQYYLREDEHKDRFERGVVSSDIEPQYLISNELYFGLIKDLEAVMEPYKKMVEKIRNESNKVLENMNRKRIEKELMLRCLK